MNGKATVKKRARSVAQKRKMKMSISSFCVPMVKCTHLSLGTVYVCSFGTAQILNKREQDYYWADMLTKHTTLMMNGVKGILASINETILAEKSN